MLGPELAKYVLATIDWWAHVDGLTFELVTAAIGESPEVVTILLHAIDNQAAHRAAVAAAAKVVIGREDWDLFDAAFFSVQRRGRNQFGRFARCPVTPRSEIVSVEHGPSLGGLRRNQNSDPESAPDPLASVTAYDPNGITVSRERDLVEEFETVRRAHNVMLWLRALVDVSDEGGDLASIREYLLADPLFQQRMAKSKPPA
jgi:hypothetical protein